MDPKVLLAIFSGTQVGSQGIDLAPFINALHLAFGAGVVASVVGRGRVARRAGRIGRTTTRSAASSAAAIRRRLPRGSPRAGSAFRHRNYRLFFVGQLVSLVGTWMQPVAQAWLVLQLTDDPLRLGVVAAAQFMPVLVLGLFGGVIADHLPKRQTLIATQAIQMIACASSLAALVVTGVVQVWHVLVLAFLLGCVNAVDMPTRQSFVVEMVGREDVGNAVALNSAMFNGARVVGPAVAGLAIGALRRRAALPSSTDSASWP